MGGQAVIEGVMMRGESSYAVAVRKADGSIAMKVHPRSTPERKPLLARLPLVRGVLALGESLSIGVSALSWSANQALPEDEPEITPRQMATSMVMALGLFVLLFVALPTSLARIVDGWVDATWQSNLIEGGIRMSIFLGYLFAVGRVAGIRRLFEYHGAEHKVIAAYEAGDVLTPTAADRYSTRHVRCGTSFLLLVMTMTVVVYSFFGRPGLATRIGTRVVLIPVIAGISFELIRLAARAMRFRGVRAVMTPGLALQRLTTRPPAPDQLEVSLASLRAVMTADQMAEADARVDTGRAPMRWVGAAIPQRV